MRLIGVTLPDKQKIDYALTTVYGIGWHSAEKILKQCKVSAQTRVKDLSEDEVKQITLIVEKNYKVEGDLREEVSDNVKRLRDIGTYRGSRHAHGLPARGQRTRSNGRTKKGKRKTVGALRKEAWAKLEQGKTGAAAAAPAAKTGKK